MQKQKSNSNNKCKSKSKTKAKTKAKTTANINTNSKCKLMLHKSGYHSANHGESEVNTALKAEKEFKSDIQTAKLNTNLCKSQITKVVHNLETSGKCKSDIQTVKVNPKPLCQDLPRLNSIIAICLYSL